MINKKATVNHINKKDKCFYYAVTVMLDHGKIKKDLQRISKIELFTNKYNWEEINFPSRKDYQKAFEKNNVTIALNVLYPKKEKLYPAFVSKHNSKQWKTNYYFSDFKQRTTMALSSSKKLSTL